MKSPTIKAGMKDNVTSATSVMRQQCISDWQSIRREYSRGINGNVSIMRTTTNVQRSVIAPPITQALEAQKYDLDNNVARAFNIPKITPSNYRLQGAYYSASSPKSLKINDNFVNGGLNKITRALNLKENNTKTEININFGKVEVKNDDDYQVVAKKIANAVNIELEKLKKKSQRTKGGGIYA